jgi:hypothetical protein
LNQVKCHIYSLISGGINSVRGLFLSLKTKFIPSTLKTPLSKISKPKIWQLLLHDRETGELNFTEHKLQLFENKDLRQTFGDKNMKWSILDIRWYSIGLRAGWSEVRVQVRGRNFSLHHRAQTGSGAKPASYPMGVGGSFSGGKATGA